MAGRKSASSLSVVAGSIDGRPAAPAKLGKREVEIWDRTVASEPAAAFKTAALQQLLVDYCRHVVTADALSKQIEAATEPDAGMDIDTLTKLVRLRDCETKASADKATKLRLTNQARYTPQAAATAAKSTTERKPWQIAS